jgi:polyisoprenyl-teichoic acid--peptidoglycan teichoic acid transferase
MDCHEARRLLDRGVTPGSASPERATLGFHLASCPACRAYRATLQERLLADLLTHEPQPPAHMPNAGAPPPAGSRLGASISKALWYAGMGVLATIVLGVVVVLAIAGWAALSIFHTHQNVQAMIVPTPPLVVDLPGGTPAAATLPPSPAAAVGAGADVDESPAPSRPGASPTQARPSATPRPAATRVPPATPTPHAPPAGEPVTILLLGSDRRPGESEPSRTDAVVIARVDPIRHRVALLSLPRDLMVEIPGYGQARINAANVWGENYGAPGGGIGLARKTVSNLLGIPIDYTVYIDFEGFIGAIDALGGVTVDVQKELYDPEFPTMDYGYTEAHFLPGPQRLDGATALMYSRIRHPDNDFERMRRQQQVLTGVLGSIRDQNALESIKKLEDMTTALRGYVKTDIPEDRLLGLAWALRDFTPEKIERYLIDENMISFGVGDDRWAELVQPQALARLVRELMSEAP